MGRGADKLRSAARRLKLAGAPPLAPPEPARRARTEAVLTGGCVRLSAQGCCPTPRRLALVSKPIVRRAALGRLARGALTASASPTRSRAGWSRCRRATSSSCSGSDDSAAEARPHRRHAPRLPFAHQPVAPVAAALAPRAPRGSRSSAGRARSQALLLPLHLHDFSLVAVGSGVVQLPVVQLPVAPTTAPAAGRESHSAEVLPQWAHRGYSLPRLRRRRPWTEFLCKQVPSISRSALPCC